MSKNVFKQIKFKFIFDRAVFRVETECYGSSNQLLTDVVQQQTKQPRRGQSSEDKKKQQGILAP